jgi:acyl-coenzyme A thioesterase PaaI-like protein
MEKWPKIDLQPSKDYSHCFGCGADNPIGLKLKFAWDAETRTARAEFIPNEHLQGWDGYVHGGITACVLDESMGWVAMLSGVNNVTAKMQVRYRQMVPLGRSYTVSCTITRRNSRLIETQAQLTDRDGNIYAEGTSTQFITSPREENG